MKLEAVISKYAKLFLSKGMKINPQCQTECEINTDVNQYKEAHNKLKPKPKEKIMKEERIMLDMGSSDHHRHHRPPKYC